jgi:hypothetical protein
VADVVRGLLARGLAYIGFVVFAAALAVGNASVMVAAWAIGGVGSVWFYVLARRHRHDGAATDAGAAFGPRGLADAVGEIGGPRTVAFVAGWVILAVGYGALAAAVVFAR